MVIRHGSSSLPGCRTVARRLPVGFCSNGVPINPHIILTLPSNRCSAFQPTIQTRSKHGPTLKASYVVLPVITSRPLRLPCTRHMNLEGFTQLDHAWRSRSAAQALGSQVLSPLSFTACRRPYPGSPVSAHTLCFLTDSGLL